MAELLSRISSRELSEWMAYYELEPFGEERADLRVAILDALTANIHSNPKKRKKAWEPADFMPFAEKKPKEAQPANVLREKWSQIIASLGGKT